MAVTSISATLSTFAQGMPPEARTQIHTLFDQHAKIRRTVTETPTGYVSLTESDDPAVAKALKTHYWQMGDRLEAGLMVRRWDPAYEEYVRYRDQIEHQVERTEKGLRITAIGKTPEAIRVARNHASAVTDFVEHGWAAHDTRHPAVAGAATKDREPAPPASEGPKCCGGGPRTSDCGSSEGGCCRQAKARAKSGA